MHDLRLGFRNLIRHRGRLALNLILLVGAFVAIISFKGFKTNILDTIKGLIIDTQYSHIEIAKRSFWENSSVDQVSDKMIENSSELINKISKIEGVKFVSPRVSFYGLLNTEDKSVAAFFIGFQPEIENKMQKSILITEGKELSGFKNAILSVGLQKKLKVKTADTVTLVGPNLYGGLNAVDLNVSGIFSSGFSDIDNGSVYLNLADAQKVLDSTAVDKLMVRLESEGDIPLVLAQLRELLKTTDLIAKSWRDSAELYNQVENFYIFQNLFIEVIILLLVLLSVANTLSMNVFERLTEIGTLRAMGDYESDIRRLFFIESALLGLISIIIGIPLSFVFVHFISSLEIPLVLPLASLPIPIKLVPTLEAYFEASAICLFSVLLGSLWPARKASRISIVLALGAKI